MAPVKKVRSSKLASKYSKTAVLLTELADLPPFHFADSNKGCMADETNSYGFPAKVDLLWYALFLYDKMGSC